MSIKCNYEVPRQEEAGEFFTQQLSCQTRCHIPTPTSLLPPNISLKRYGKLTGNLSQGLVNESIPPFARHLNEQQLN